jgi:hypothetical protein
METGSMADEQRHDRDDERKDRTPYDDRAASDSEKSRDGRAPDLPARAPLTRREREERWPIG